MKDKKTFITDIDKFLYEYYGYEDDLTARDIIITTVESTHIDNERFCKLVLDNHLNNSGDIYGLLSVILEYLNS